MTCPSCQADNAAQNKFCGQCGTSLGAADTAPSPPQTPAVEQEAERRHLTVMFCDLANSTALSEQLDPKT